MFAILRSGDTVIIMRVGRRLLVTVGLVGAVGTVTLSSSLASGGSGPAALQPQHTVEACGGSAATARYVPVDLGRSFAGLALTSVSELCQRAPRAVGPPAPVRFSSRSYGDCRAVSEVGCTPPLEVQSWPECRRDLASYTADDPIGRMVLAHHLIRLSQRPELPVASFEGGSRLEFYTGSTTVVVTAVSPALARAAADQAARQVPPSLPASSAKASAAVASRALRRLATRPTPPPGTAPVGATSASPRCLSPSSG